MNPKQYTGHGELQDATIQLYDDEIEALQCVDCEMKVPKDDPSAFEKHDYEYVQRFLAPKLRTKEDREDDRESQ